jgi:hypothetical protein
MTPATFDRLTRRLATASPSRRGLLGLLVTTLPLVAARWGIRPSVAQSPAAQGAGTVCVQRYALCTAAPCVPSPTDPTIAVCRCFVEDGPSFGNTACAQRAPAGNTLYSAFSLQNITSESTFMTCPAGSPWANCLDVVCTVDPADPTQALCQCVTVQTDSFITFGGTCDVSTCTTVIWSAATADMIMQAVAQYTAVVQPKGTPVLLPTSCM